MTVTSCITQIGFWRVVRCSYEIAYICEVCTFHLWYYFENLPMKSANSGNDDDIMILQTYWNQYHRPLQTPRSGYTEPPPTEGPTPGPGAEWVFGMLMLLIVGLIMRVWFGAKIVLLVSFLLIPPFPDVKTTHGLWILKTATVTR